MADVINGISNILTAFISMDSFEIAEAFQGPAAYVVGTFLAIVGGYLIMLVLRAVPFLDTYLEKIVRVTTYLFIATVIFVDVIRRFVFHVQAPWSTTLPPYLLLNMTWVG